LSSFTCASGDSIAAVGPSGHLLHNHHRTVKLAIDRNPRLPLRRSPIRSNTRDILRPRVQQLACLSKRIPVILCVVDAMLERARSEPCHLQVQKEVRSSPRCDLLASCRKQTRMAESPFSEQREGSLINKCNCKSSPNARLARLATIGSLFLQGAQVRLRSCVVFSTAEGVDSSVDVRLHSCISR
jgi:hypothetical protein